jgi:hypothetical protein
MKPYRAMFDTERDYQNAIADADDVANDIRLRDEFAMHAIGRCIEVMAQFVMEAEDFEPGTVGLSEVARRASVFAYAVADQMLKARK